MSLNGFWARLARSADNPVASSPSTAVASTGVGAVLTLSFVTGGSAITYGASIVTVAGESPRTSDSSALRTMVALAASIGFACCAYHASSAPVGLVTLSASIQSAIASSQAGGTP